jgi:hypothetical protein
MATAFEATLKALEANRRADLSRSIALEVVGVVFVVAWLAWSMLARVSVWAVSADAHVEPERGNPGALRAVASYLAADALGRVSPGQRARVRLDGFPWTEFGTIAAVVSSVSTEPQSSRVRVELALRPDPRSRIPLQSGLPGSVQVEVERSSPANLVLRAAGRAVSGQQDVSP